MSENNHDDDKTQTHIPLMKDTMVGHYRIVDKIGVGGMGEVYLAWDTELERSVALKFLSARLCQEEDCRKRFKREARAAAALSNPHIVTVHEVADYQGRPFIVMEYVRGQSLRELIKSAEMPLAQVVELGLQICTGLAKAHETGITHRDIKPSNIIVDDEGCAKLLDFGLATIEGSERLTKTGSTTGTVGYMSPEQLRGEEVDHRSDIFSLGIVLYEMITGCLPFEGDRDAAVIHSILHSMPKPLEEHREVVPETLQSIVDKALKKDIKARYRDIAELATDLDQLSHELETGELSALRKRRKKRQGLFIGAGILVVIATGLILAHLIIPQKVNSLWRQMRFSTGASLCELQIELEPFVVVVAPFLGRTNEAIEEGTVMQALIEREVFDRLGGKKDVRILGRDIAEVPTTHEEAMALGEKHEASVVLWGEVLILRGEAEIQPYVTIVKRGQGSLNDTSMAALEADLAEPNQLALRKTKAGEVGDMALLVAARYYFGRDLERSLDLLSKLSNPSAESYCLQGDLLLSAGQQNRAGESFRNAYLLDSISVRPSYKLGRCYSLEGEHDSSIAILQKALTHHPENELLLHQMVSTYRMAGKHEQAATFLRSALTRDPGSAELRIDLGWVLWHMRRVEEAISEHEKAIDLSPENGDSYYGIGWIYEFTDSLDQAIEYYERAIHTGTKRWGKFAPHFTLGRTYIKQGEYEMAISALCDALALNPWYVPSLVFLGQAYKGLEKGDEALAIFQQAIDLNPGNSLLLRTYGEFNESLGDTIAAISAYHEAIAHDPDNIEAYFYLRRAYVQSARGEEAISWFREAIGFNPESRQLHLQFGRLLYELSDTVGAVAEWKEAMHIDPEHGDAYYWLGWVRESQDSLDGAIEYYQKAAKLGTDEVYKWSPHFRLGIVYYNQEKYEASVSECLKTIEIEPQFVHTYQYLAAALQRLGKQDEAIRRFRDAIAYNPKNATLHNYFAQFLQWSNDSPGALGEYNEAIRLDPENGDVYCQLGWLYEQMDSLEMAASSFESALVVGVKWLSEVTVYSSLQRVYAAQERYEDAIEAVEGAKAQAPLNAFQQLVLGSYYSCLGRLEEAVSEYAGSIRLDSSDVYGHLFYFLALHQAGRSAVAEEYLAQYSINLENDSWPSKIVRFLNGEIDKNTLLAAAEIDSEIPNLEKSRKMAEAYYYLGMAYVLDLGRNIRSDLPDSTMALEYFKNCVNTGEQGIVEYRLAKAEIRRLRDSGI